MSQSSRVVSSRTCASCHSPLPDDAAYCDQCGTATHTQVIGETMARSAGGANSSSYVTQPGRLARALGPNLQLGPLIGRGGYAEVFQVHDHKLNRELAIKVLRPDLIVTPSLLERFRREALAVAALRHPAIVPVFDVGEADGICYIVMPLIEGESLKAVLQRQHRLPIEEVQRIVREAASALAAAHEANVVHRDIKPENIMLEGKDRSVRLMDFGIAKAVDSGDKELTGTGVVVGTPQYMSPEQATGEPNVDPRSDQYSLAVVAYQMLSGRAPFEGETARAIIAKQLLDQPPPLADLLEKLPPHVTAALHRALQKSPGNRFDRITDFAAALQNPAYVNPPTLDPPRPGPIRWLPWLAGSLAAGLLIGFALIQWRPTSPIVEPLPPAQPPPPIGTSAPDTRPPAAATSSLPASPATPRDTGRLGAQRPLPAPPPPPKADSATPTPPPAPGCAALVEQREWERALTRCTEEAQSGNVRASRLVADLLVEGRGTVAADPGRAVPFFEQAARGGDAEAAFWLGKHYESGDPSGATEMYLKAATGRVTRAYPIIARRFDQGLGTAVDPAQAATWYQRAAESGDVASQIALADLYARGRGVARNDAVAFSWYEAAATANNADAQYRLARLYFEGKGTKKSESDGLKWLKLAADAGHPEAKRELGRRKD